MRIVRRVFSRLACTSLALLMVTGAGCNEKKRAVPPGPPPLPGLAAGRNMHAPDRSGQMPADHPAMLRSRAEMEAEGAAPPAAAPSAAVPTVEGTVQGTIRVDDKVKDKVKSGSVLFLVARAHIDGGGAGPVLAARRFTVETWPLAFELSQGDVMIEGVKLSGKVVLTARVDQDGDAMTKSPGDVEGTSAAITVPAQGVEVLLDKVRTDAAGTPSPAGMGQGAMPAGHPTMPPGHPAMPPGHPSMPSGPAPVMPPAHP